MRISHLNLRKFTARHNWPLTTEKKDMHHQILGIGANKQISKTLKSWTRVTTSSPSDILKRHIVAGLAINDQPRPWVSP